MFNEVFIHRQNKESANNFEYKKCGTPLKWNEDSKVSAHFMDLTLDRAPPEILL